VKSWGGGGGFVKRQSCLAQVERGLLNTLASAHVECSVETSKKNLFIIFKPSHGYAMANDNFYFLLVYQI